jgi:N-acetylglutamate synthase-like GNAT family acetyltransferase
LIEISSILIQFDSIEYRKNSQIDKYRYYNIHTLNHVKAPLMKNKCIDLCLLTDADYKNHIPVLAELCYEEISRHWSSEASIEKNKLKLSEHLNDTKLPLAIVAINDGKPVGIACLRETDGIKTGTTPWLGSLVVHPQYRGIKLGEVLIDAVKMKAKELGYDVLYLLAFDLTIPDWYARLGWQRVGHDELFGHRVAVMSIAL